MKHFSLLSFLFLFLSLPQCVDAQTTYTDYLRKRQAEQGTIIINQEAEIEKIVNGRDARQDTRRQANESTAGKTNSATTEEHEKESSTAAHRKQYTGERTRHKARGYRICIFTGGNSRADKTKAYQMAQRCKNLFGELSVYPFFESPRWVCHVGDFKEREDAQRYVNSIRKARISYEVRIVRSEVNVVD